MKRMITLSLLVLCLSLHSQDYTEISNLKTGDYEADGSSLTGLWTVNKVKVGDEELTPTARWFELLADGTQRAGNGWLQNFEGKWQYDAAARKFASIDAQGRPDEYGPFTVTLEGKSMTWQRTEDGMPVTVSLSLATEKPRAPWDLILGGWTLERAEQGQEGSDTLEMTEPDAHSYYFLWDRSYRKFDSEGKRIETGIWQIGGHNTWLRLVSNQTGATTGRDITVDNNRMTFVIKEGQTVKKLYFSRE